MRYPGFLALILAGLLATPAHAYEETSVADGGTIAGKVVFKGTVPTEKIVVTKDKDVCGGIRDEPQIIVGPDGGAKDVVVRLVDVASGKAWGEMNLQKPVLDQEHCVFRPRVQVMAPGTLDVVNSDPLLHNTHGYYGKRTAFNLALPNQGQTIETELTRPGEVRVDCDAHGWMEAWIYVVDNPYFAVTAEDGSFTVADVPPGDYKLVTIHELTGQTEASVSVKAGETAELAIELSQ